MTSRKISSRQDGFSLLELVVSSGIVLVVLTFMGNYMASTINRHKQLAQQQNLSAESANLFRALDVSLGNAFRLLPNEDLYVKEDGLYQGLNEINPPTGCLTMSPDGMHTYPAVRWTTILRRFSAESLLRPFEEGTPQVNMDDAARLSYKNETGRLFRSGEETPEVTIFDVDGWLVRRFKTITAAQKTSVFSPYDDFSPIFPPITYTQVQLVRPDDGSGDALDTMAAKFLTGSTAYSTRTKVLCVGTDNRIMIVDESSGKTQNFMNTDADSLELESLEISYEANLDGENIDRNVTSPFPGSVDTAKCIEAIRFTVGLKDKRSSTDEVKYLTHITSVPNFSSRQPASCL